MQLENRLALSTGAGRDIGRAIALAYAAVGALCRMFVPQTLWYMASRTSPCG